MPRASPRASPVSLHCHRPSLQLKFRSVFINTHFVHEQDENTWREVFRGSYTESLITMDS